MGPLGASVRALRSNCGHPLPDFPALSHRKSRYAALRASLLHDGVAPERCPEEALNELVCALRRFIERTFGRNSDPDKRQGLVAIPAWVFRDFSPSGPLNVVLQTIFRYMREREMKQIDYDDAEREADCLRTVIEIDQALREGGFIGDMKVFISPLVEDEEKETLRDVLQAKGAAVVSYPSVATHVVYPDPDGVREHQTDGQVLVRVLERARFDDDELCFLHWFHHPDSYDDWVPGHEVLGHVYVPRKRQEREVWHVHARWVRDLELYNEFMNELDYEMPATFTDLVGQSPKLLTAEKTSKPYSTLVRLRLRLPRESEESPTKVKTKEEGGGAASLGSHANKKTNDTDIDSDGDRPMEDADGASGEDGNEQKDNGEASGENVENGETGDKDPNAKISIGNGAFMPHFTKWFKLEAVHDIEKRALPEFFDGRFPSKNEGTYQEIRNYMVETWRKKPKEYLSSTAARKRLSGDACCILRVHGFLEHWGLINYDSSVEGAPPPSFVPPPRPLPLRAAALEGDDSVRARKQLLLDSGGKAQIKGGMVVKYGRNGEVQGSGRKEAVLIRDTDRGGNPSPIAETPEREPIEYHCDSCGIDCSQLRFHCATKADVDLCASCYQNAKYSSTMKPRDFIQMNSAGAHGNADDIDVDVWTESETLLLLEALEMYGANWTLVSEHVGSKGKSQCVIQFLRLPIEDSFMNTTSQKWWGVQPKGGVDDMSPLEMMKRAGARDSALGAVSEKLSGSKAYSGLAVAHGDQYSTIGGFASMLASVTPVETLKEVARVMGIDGTQKRRRDSFMSLAGTLHVKRKASEDAMEDDDAKAEVDGVTDEELLTSRVYDELRKGIPLPSKVLSSEKGEKVARGALSLIKHGAIPILEVPKMQFQTSPRTLLQQVDDTAQVISETEDDAQAERCGVGSITLKNGQEVNGPSAKAVGVAALAAACVSASSRQELEEAEIDRLHALVSEVRIERIRRKREILRSMSEHERIVEQYRKRRRGAEIVERVNRVAGMLRGRSEVVSSEGGPVWVWGKGAVGPVDVGGNSGGSEENDSGGIIARTAEDEFCVEAGRVPLPDFSNEIALQKIRGMQADGKVVAEDFENGSDVDVVMTDK